MDSTEVSMEINMAISTAASLGMEEGHLAEEVACLIFGIQLQLLRLSHSLRVSVHPDLPRSR
jgi:hypothetical protein